MSRRLRHALLAASAGLASLGAVAAPASASVTPVPQLDQQRYLGEWRQIAAIPQWFEALCLRDTAASYAPGPDGTIAVTNRCKGPLGANVFIRGRARTVDTVTNAQLQVSFAPAFGGGYSFSGTKPNYIVIGLGENYEWAIVADPDRTSTFLLARSASLSAEQLETAKAIIKANGINPCKLRVTPQYGGLQKATGLCYV